MKKKVFMFSGQGSQYYHMGRELFYSNETFKSGMLRFEDMAQSLADLSILDELYREDKKHEEFDNIVLTHPALYAVQLSMADVLGEAGIYPDAVLGYSLGEYIAAAIAGVYSAEEGLKLLIHQSYELTKFTEAGAMMVILGDMNDLAKEGLLDGLAVVTENYAGNFIVSGKRTEVLSLHQELKKRIIYCELLPIKFPFHSKYIDPLMERAIQFGQTIDFQMPEIPFYSCAEGSRIDAFSSEHLWRIVRNPILFYQTVMEIRADIDATLIDLGPSGSLAATIKQFEESSSIETYRTMSRFGNDIKEVNSLKGFFEVL